MSPPSSTLCFLSCFPLSLFTSVIVYLYLLPLTSYVHIKDPCLASSKAGNLCPPFLALSHTFTSFRMRGLLLLSSTRSRLLMSLTWDENGARGLHEFVTANVVAAAAAVAVAGVADVAAAVECVAAAADVVDMR